MKESKNIYKFEFNALYDSLNPCSEQSELTLKLHHNISTAFSIVESNFFLFNNYKQLVSQKIDISISLDKIVNHLEEEGITDWVMEKGSPTVISDLFAENSSKSSIILIPIVSGQSGIGLFVARSNIGKSEFSEQMLSELNNAVKLASIIYDKLDRYDDNSILKRRLRAVEKQVLQSSKFASAGELAYSIANEIQASLKILDGHIKFLETGVGDTKRRIKIIKKELSNIKSKNRKLSGLLDVSEMNSGNTGLNICAIMDEIIQLTSHQLEKDNIIIEKSYDIDNDIVSGSKQMLEQAFLNIILSAGNHMIEGGTLMISISAFDNSNLIINFSDTNPNPYSLNVEDIFEPFYSSGKNKEKFNKGLYLTQMIIRQHGGKVSAISEEGRGRTIKIVLPVRSK